MQHGTASKHGGSGHYIHLGTMTTVSFLAMYGLMYAMVDRFSNVFSNLNQLYMAALMTAAMVIIELVVMRAMYPDKRVNLAIIGVATIALVGSWFAIRAQTGITDRQFLKSMIPHHGGAILMCENATLSDPELQTLCKAIRESQQGEIDLMKNKLARATR